MFQGGERAARKQTSELERQYAGVTLAVVERTVEDAMADWQVAHVEWARLTMRDYASRVGFVAQDLAFACTRLDQLRRGHVDAWVKRMRLAGVPAAAIKNRVAGVRSAIAHAVDAEHLTATSISRRFGLGTPPSAVHVVRSVSSMVRVRAITPRAAGLTRRDPRRTEGPLAALRAPSGFRR